MKTLATIIIVILIGTSAVMAVTLIRALGIPGLWVIMGISAVLIYWMWRRKKESPLTLTPEEKEERLRTTQEAAERLRKA